MTDYKNKIEAVLFASGRYMDTETLLNLTGASSKQVLINNIRKIKQEYDSRQSPLMVVEEKDGWKLTVRESYLPLVRNIVSETELQKSVLETLAVIAWRAPVLQSEVVNIRHNKAYDHISELMDLGFIKKEPSGRSYLITLTEKFYEYFDVEGAKDIRDVFNKVVGMPDQTKVEDFGQNEVEGETQEIPESEEFSELDDHQDASEELSELDNPEAGEHSELEESEEFSELDAQSDEEKTEIDSEDTAHDPQEDPKIS